MRKNTTALILLLMILTALLAMVAGRGVGVESSPPPVPGGAASADPTAPAVPEQRDPNSPLRIHCSPSAFALLGPLVEHASKIAHPRRQLRLVPDSDRRALARVLAGNCDAAVIGIQLPPGARRRDLATQVLGYRIAVPVVHARNPVTSVSKAQMTRLLSGQTKSWSELGWVQRRINRVGLASNGLGDPAALLLQMEGTAPPGLALTEAEVLERIRGHRHAVGLLSLRAFKKARGVRALRPGGTGASVYNYQRGAYTRACIFQLVFRHGRRDIQPLQRALARIDIKRRIAAVLTLP